MPTQLQLVTLMLHLNQISQQITKAISDLQQEFEKNLKGNPKRSKKRSKGKAPAVKKAKAASVESNRDLVEFLQESRQSKDHELFERLAEKKAERDLKSQKIMFDAIKEIAKMFKRDG